MGNTSEIQEKVVQFHANVAHTCVGITASI